MATNPLVYDLFLRNWKNHIAQETHIEQAVRKGLITFQEGQTILNTPR